MSKIAEFSRYVGLVVVLSAAILLAPRATVAAWAGLTGWVRSRWEDVTTWRPRTMRAEPHAVPVEIQIPVRRTRAHPEAELLEPQAAESPREAARALWGLGREVLEAGALALAVAGLAVRSAGRLVEVLPEPAVFAGDLLLVLATFVVMQRVIRDYPAHLLPALRHPRRPRPQRVPAAARPARAGRLDHALTLSLQTVAVFVTLAWPSELGRELAGTFGPHAAPGTAAVVAWACELPWLTVVALWLSRRTSPRLSAPLLTARPTLTLTVLPHDPLTEKLAA